MWNESYLEAKSGLALRPIFPLLYLLLPGSNLLYNHHDLIFQKVFLSLLFSGCSRLKPHLCCIVYGEIIDCPSILSLLLIYRSQVLKLQIFFTESA